MSAFIEAVHQVAGGGTVLDPTVIRQLIGRRSRGSKMDRLTDREREVLGEMAQGRSNAASAAALCVTEKAISKHTNAIFSKFDLPLSSDDNRRVLAVLAYLNG